MLTKELVRPQTELESSLGEAYKLVLHNDDFNTFDWVIECLIEICEHTAEQAEQCAMLVHFKGKCAVKSGSFDYLLPRRRALEERGLTCTVEQ